MHLWDQLLPKTEIRLKLLSQSNTIPIVLMCVFLIRPFYYKKIPLVPMGCAVQIHKKTDQLNTWSHHAVDGWYLATSPENYRMHLWYAKATNSECFTDTVQFNNKHITNPTITHVNKVM